MNAILIEETKGTPRVEFYPDGNLFIQGRSLPLDPVGFYNPVLEWVKECKAPAVKLEISLEYLNTSSSKQLYSILYLLKENPNINQLSINWLYEEGDEDGYDMGREFESLIEIPFTFEEYAEVSD